MLLLLTGCQQAASHKNKEITMQALSDMKVPAFVLDAQTMKRQLRQLARNDNAHTMADRQARALYTDSICPVFWIDGFGVDSRADSLLARLQQVEQIGFSPRSFYVETISKDLQLMRQLQFDESEGISQVAARLEYYLTKACLRYAYGQRFGYINPQQVFNHLDVEKQDSLHRMVQYRGLFDIDMDLPTASYAKTVVRKIQTDSLSEYLSEIQPQGKYYEQMKQMLAKATTDDERRRVLCNMERGRWRLHHPIPDDNSKHIVVNIPAFHLYAYQADSVLDMRIACGATTTKTPLLTSEMEWMEVNPEWVIPKSILETDVARRAGDSAYFARNRYQIFERATNKQLEVSEVTRAMLLSGKYRVAQKSGSDNSLGRIVFRFKNRFSVFLHYTSTPGVFNRDVRAVSHGCVRVAKPYELAEFVLDNPDPWLLDRIHISMGLGALTDRGRQYLQAHRTDEDHKLIGYVPVKPHVPLYIIYNTLWPDETGAMQTWPDVYGYDRVIWQHLQPYMQ